MHAQTPQAHKLTSIFALDACHVNHTVLRGCIHWFAGWITPLSLTFEASICHPSTVVDHPTPAQLRAFAGTWDGGNAERFFIPSKYDRTMRWVKSGSECKIGVSTNTLC